MDRLAEKGNGHGDRPFRPRRAEAKAQPRGLVDNKVCGPRRDLVSATTGLAAGRTVAGAAHPVSRASAPKTWHHRPCAASQLLFHDVSGFHCVDKRPKGTEARRRVLSRFRARLRGRLCPPGRPRRQVVWWTGVMLVSVGTGNTLLATILKCTSSLSTTAGGNADRLYPFPV